MTNPNITMPRTADERERDRRRHRAMAADAPRLAEDIYNDVLGDPEPPAREKLDPFMAAVEIARAGL